MVRSTTQEVHVPDEHGRLLNPEDDIGYEVNPQELLNPDEDMRYEVHPEFGQRS